MKSEIRGLKSKDPGVLICFALGEEAAPFRKLAANRNHVSILITGMGQPNARMSVGKVLAESGSRRRETAEGESVRVQTSAATVFTCGFAGGLNPALALGDVVFETSDAALREKLTVAGAKPAKLLCFDRIAVTAAEKAELRRSTGADAVEMESGAIQRLCRERGIPCATVRVISDTAQEDLPLDFNQLTKPDLGLDYRKLAWAIAKSPGMIPALLRLQRTCRFAAQRLANTLVQVF